MIDASALERVKADEGFRAQAYRDTAGKLTIGYGFNVDAGISEFAASALCDAQLQERALFLQRFWWARGLDPVRFGVIVEMAFNLGTDGLMNFVQMLACVGRKDWAGAKAAMLDSDAARELPVRYARLAEIILTGIP